MDPLMYRGNDMSMVVVVLKVEVDPTCRPYCLVSEVWMDQPGWILPS